MINKIAHGKAITIPAPSDLKEGDILVMGQMVGVVNTAALTGEPVVVDLEGIFEFPFVAVPGVSLTVGTPVFMTAVGSVTGVGAPGAILVGLVAQAPATSDTTVLVKINHGFQAGPKVFTGIANQSGVDPLVMTELENTIGEIVWSWDGAHTAIVGDLVGGFKEDKTVANGLLGATPLPGVVSGAPDQVSVEYTTYVDGIAGALVKVWVY